jgi:hypothetical protein
VREVTGISGPIFGKQRSLKTFVFFRGLLFQRQVVERNREAICAARSGCYNGHRWGKSNARHLAQHLARRRRQSAAPFEWVTARSPDVVVMPEWRDNPSGDVLRSGLEQRGFQVATAALLKKSSNGVLLAANRPFQFRCCKIIHS